MSNIRFNNTENREDIVNAVNRTNIISNANSISDADNVSNDNNVWNVNNVSNANSLISNTSINSDIVLPKIIAVDFDGTLCEQCWPEIGKPNLKLIGELIYRRSLGDKVILWTCRAGINLVQAVRWCKSYGLTFDAVNENIPEVIQKYGSDSRKISADVYIDDRSEKPWTDLLADKSISEVVA